MTDEGKFHKGPCEKKLLSMLNLMAKIKKNKNNSL